MKNLARFLRLAREKAKLTKNALALAAGLDPSLIGRMEDGAPIRVKSLHLILTALGMRPGSADYIEAFALHAADSSLAQGIAPVSRAEVASKINSRARSRAINEGTLLGHFRALTPDQQDTITSLLKNPVALDGLHSLLHSKL